MQHNHPIAEPGDDHDPLAGLPFTEPFDPVRYHEQVKRLTTCVDARHEEETAAQWWARASATLFRALRGNRPRPGLPRTVPYPQFFSERKASRPRLRQQPVGQWHRLAAKSQAEGVLPIPLRVLTSNSRLEIIFKIEDGMLAVTVRAIGGLLCRPEAFANRGDCVLVLGDADPDGEHTRSLACPLAFDDTAAAHVLLTDTPDLRRFINTGVTIVRLITTK